MARETLEGPLADRWKMMEPKSPEHKLSWFTIGHYHISGLVRSFVAGIVQLDEPSIWSVRCVGPNGLGAAIQQSGFGLTEAVQEAELTLRDLGWHLTPEGFYYYDDRKEEVVEGHNGQPEVR